MSEQESKRDEDAFVEVARIATMSNGANKIAAALLTRAVWGGSEFSEPDEVLKTYKRMLHEIEEHDSERGL